MNERIQQLLYEAGGENGGVHPTTGQTVIYTDEVNYEKFAELIVRECLDIVQRRWINPDEIEIANEIKKHFGIEE